ncbi:geminin [Carabus blaptoides fortunei]
MRTDASGKLIIKAPSNEQQENIKNSRKTLKVLQQAATDKENLVGRAHRSGKDILSTKTTQSDSTESDTKRKKVSNKYVQTGSGVQIDVNDLTSEAGPSENYWEVLAEKRRIALDESLEENQRLHEENETLREENRICKEMLDESKHLVEVLTEMLNENDTSVNEPDETLENADEAVENE